MPGRNDRQKLPAAGKILAVAGRAAFDFSAGRVGTAIAAAFRDRVPPVPGGRPEVAHRRRGSPTRGAKPARAERGTCGQDAGTREGALWCAEV